MLYRLFEFLAACLGVLWSIWSGLPTTWQTPIICVLVAGIIYKRGHNDAVNADFREGVKKLDANRRARLK